MPLDMTTDSLQGRVPITVLRLQGELDGRSFESLIDQANNLYQGGTRDLLLDMSELSFIASSGLAALHSVALIMRGGPPPSLEHGWGAFRAMADEVAIGQPEEHFRLLKPQPKIRKVLVTTGFSQFLAIYEDEDAAVAAF